MNLVLFGPPGSGKGTQAQKVCQAFRLRHISTGDELRAAIIAKSPVGLRASEIMARGELVSDELVTELLRTAIVARRAETDSFLFDGYPRTTSQVGQLDQLCEEQKLQQPAVVLLHVPDETLLLRMTGRRICTECKRSYNVYFSPSRRSGVCDFCHAPLMKRVDDNAETIRERLKIYHDQSVPVLKQYEKRGVLATIDATGDTELVFQKISRILEQYY